MLSLLLAAAVLVDTPATGGVQLGAGWFRPSVSVAGGYDSAVGYAFSPPPIARVQGDVLLRPAVGLAFDLETPRTRLSYHGGVSYELFAGLLPGSQQLRFLGFWGRLETELNRHGFVGARLGGATRLSDVTSAVTAIVPMISIDTRLWAVLPIRIPFVPLELAPRIRAEHETFTALGRPAPADPRLSPVAALDYGNLQPGLTAKWGLRPQTVLFIDASLDWRVFLQRPPPQHGQVFFEFGPQPARVLKVSTGVAGIVVSRLAVRAWAGAAADLSGSQPSSPLVRAELAYLGDAVGVSGGYLRSLEPTPFGGAMRQDRGYASFAANAGGKLLAAASVAVDFLAYGQQPLQTLLLTSGKASLTWQATSFFAAGLSYTLTYRAGSAPLTGFLRHEPMLTVTFSYGPVVPPSLPVADPTELDSPALDAPRAPASLLMPL